MNNLTKTLIATTAILIAVIAIQLLTASSEKEDPVADATFQKHFNTNYKIYALTHPDALDFAGEKTPMELVDVREKLDRELLINTYWQSQSMLLHKRANRYFPVIEPILKKNGVPDDFKYLCVIESGMQNVVSPAGATGFWQIMEGTGTDYGLEIEGEVDERYHLEKSTEVACQYLKNAKEKYGSWTMAAAAYNLGMNGLQRQVERQKATNYYDLLLVDETARYVYRILAAKLILSNPRDYGFHYRNKDLYPPIETYTVSVDTSVIDFADFAFHHGINYKILKLLNPWLRDSFLKNTRGKKYEIALPKNPKEIGLYPLEEYHEKPDSLKTDSLSR